MPNGQEDVKDQIWWVSSERITALQAEGGESGRQSPKCLRNPVDEMQRHKLGESKFEKIDHGREST